MHTFVYVVGNKKKYVLGIRCGYHTIYVVGNKKKYAVGIRCGYTWIYVVDYKFVYVVGNIWVPTTYTHNV